MRLQLCVILLACATCPPLALALVGGINLREGRPADLPIIQATLARNLMNFIALTPRHFIVAESKASNELVGWGQVKPVVEGRTYELSGLYVNEAERGRGVGASIVKQLLQKHRNQHGSATDLLLLTLNDDLRVPFYERFGFGMCRDMTCVAPSVKAELWLGGVIQSVARGPEVVLMKLER